MPSPFLISHSNLGWGIFLILSWLLLDTHIGREGSLLSVEGISWLTRLHQNEVCNLCRTSHNNHDGIMLSRYPRKPCNEFHGNDFPFPLWYHNQLQQSTWELTLCLHMLIIKIPSHKIFYIPLEVQPILKLLYYSQCLMITQVTLIQFFIKLPQDHPHEITIV